MQKLIVITLLLAMLAGFAGSCAEKDVSVAKGDDITIAGETTEAAETEKILETEDLGGFEICILNYDTSWFSWANTSMNAEELNGEVLNDALFNRTLKTEQNFNAVVKFELVKDTQDVFGRAVLAGDDIYDMVMLFDASIAKIGRASCRERL